MTASALPPVRPLAQPLLVKILASVGLVFLFLPLVALVTRVDVGAVPGIMTAVSTRKMLVVTLGSAVLSTIFTLLMGVPLAVWLATTPKAAQFIRFLVYLPLAMPPVVAGLALSAAIGRRGVFAPLLDLLQIQFAFTFAGVVVSHAFIALPFVTITVDAALRSLDKEIFRSAVALGMSPGQVFRRLMLPLLTPAIITGAGLSFARSLGEFGTTITFAGSLPGVTRTLPIGIYLLREVEPAQAYVLAVVLMSVAIGSLALTVLPELFRSAAGHKIVAVDEGAIDGAALRDLCAPNHPGPAITVHSNRTPLHISPGVCTALIGPNGSGKSTLAALIAGRYARTEKFRVHITGPVKPPVMLTQNPALPPHCTVAEALDMVSPHTSQLLTAAGLFELYDVPTAHLSGGQAAQIALLRALATRPEVLILDEPLAAIDVSSAEQWRKLLGYVLCDRTVVLISHNPIEIGVLAQEVISMTAAEIHSALAVDEFFSCPPDQFAAEFIGVCRIECTKVQVIDDLAVGYTDELTVVGLPWGTPQAEAVALFSPHSVTVAVDEPRKSSARNCWRAVITEISNHAGIARLSLKNGNTRFAAVVTQKSVVEQQLGVGKEVYCTVKAVEITVR